MNIDFTNKADMMSSYGLSETQYDHLLADISSLPPAERQALDEQFVLKWKQEKTDSGAEPNRPQLPAPARDAVNFGRLSSWVGAAVPSPGASIMALVTEHAAEQRRQNKELAFQESYAIADQMMSQAQEIRNKAVTQIVMGVVSGAVSIAQGAATIALTAKAPTAPKGVADDSAEMIAFKAESSNYAARTQAFGNIMDGVNKAMASTGQAAGGFFDATVKEMDADIEKKRALIENLRAINQSFSEVIQKSLSSMDSIQQGFNQARAKILG